MARQRQIVSIGDGSGGGGGQIHRLEPADRVLAIAAGERQQLLGQMNGPLDCGAEARAGLAGCRFVRGAIEQLQLQAQCRERRSQFVRRIGNERLLGGECLLQACQESIEFADQRRDLNGEILFAERRQTAGVATLNFGGHVLQRLQAAAHAPGDRDQHHGKQERQRDGYPRRGGPRQLFAHPYGLGNLNDSVGRLQTEGSPSLAAQLKIGDSQAPFD